MTVETFSLALDIGLALAGALLLAAALKGVAWLLDLVPMNRARREAVGRAAPVLAVLIAGAYLLLAARRVFGGRPGYESVIAGVILIAGVAAVWPALREIMAGVFIKAGRVCKVGDVVRVDGVQGTVRRMGLLVIAVETPRGEEAILPYSRVGGAPLVRTAAQDRLATHSFSLRVPDELGMVQAKALIREAALCSHWSAIHREPEVKHSGDGTFEVTVYALDADRGPEIERLVRLAVAPSEKSPSSRR